jgi:hypothetical protein
MPAALNSGVVNPTAFQHPIVANCCQISGVSDRECASPTSTAEGADRRLVLPVTWQDLHGTQIACGLVDYRRVDRRFSAFAAVERIFHLWCSRLDGNSSACLRYSRRCHLQPMPILLLLPVERGRRRAVHFDPRSAGASNQGSQPKAWSRKYSRPNILVSLVAIVPSAVAFRNPFAFIVPTASEGWQQSALRDFWWPDRFHL